MRPRENIKITLIEIPSIPAELARPNSITEPTKSTPLPEVEMKTSVKRQIPFPKSYNEEESLLQERLNRLKGSRKIKDIPEDESSFLRDKLAHLEKRRGGEKKHEEAQALMGGSKSQTPPSAADEKLSEEYLFLIKRKFQNHFEIPIYLRNKKNLFALVELEISSTGVIRKITYLKKGEDPQFNQAVERCLIAVNPLPVDREMRLRIEFRAEGGILVN
ncbi:MAG: TonB C-terminal domain-containing protein [Caldimicrobium sp.]|nr:TonB C-terminal domain-containing protein [Caldimicrobium sp.]MDW8094045.1 TonB C-terminal domain-containing protein [Caldimicrobium sp.]